MLDILLVEDNATNQKLMKRLLGRLGHEVTVAENGEVALSALEQARFDLILMDIDMPVMDGWEATRRIREREGSSGRRIPIAAITAHVMVEDRRRCQEVGMDEFLAKPIYPAELEALIARMASRGEGASES